MRVLGLIPARGGSQGIPRKNVRDLGGVPLIGYTITAAQKAMRVDRIVVSTEDREIAAVAKSLGADVPFIRPQSLARNETPMLPVIRNAIEALTDDGWAPDVVCLLQPTFPFRRADDIDACVDALQEKNADCVISVHRVPHHFNPHWVYFQKPDGSLELATGGLEPIPRRQELPAAFHRSGAVYVSRAKLILQRGSLYGDRVFGYETPAESACNIDTMSDWSEAEAMVKHWRSDAAG
ncbi:MAG: acylneuraminate cytidylyltransferase family protein [Myxococcales bacterium]|nr:acylneuraminate cytidylyltransferase family protein [Myxococcales bacterium]